MLRAASPTPDVWFYELGVGGAAYKRFFPISKLACLVNPPILRFNLDAAQ